MNGNPTLQFRQSRWKHLGLILLFFVMAGVSYFCATRADDPVYRGVGWVGAVFFALGILASVRTLIVGGAPITMDETGFTDVRLKVGTIPWNQVAECYVAWLKGTSFLCFQLKQPELYFHPLSKAAQRVRKLNRAWGFGDLSFSFVGLSPSLEEAVEFVRARGIEVVERRVIP